MASTHKHIRSSTANKRPTTAIADGQIALNTNSTSPGLFFKDSTGATVIKVGPVHVGTTAPNVSPASGGSSGNSTGEIWLDTSLTPNGVKIWNGSSWTNATPIGSTTVQGLLELATNAETQTGTDVDRAVTPAGLQSKVSDSTSTTSSTTIASSTAVKAAYDLADAALPKAGGTVTGNLEIGTTGSLTFEGATADGFETTLAVTDPTADRTITLPDVSGTVVTTGDTGTVTSTMIANGTIVDADVNASAAIAHSKLANITAGSVLLGNASNVPTATALSGDVTINSSGVTAIGSGVIVDADVSASAEIAVSKLADGTARQLLQTDAAGTGVEWTSNVDIPGTLDVTGAAVFDSTANIAGNLTVDTNTLFVDATNNRVGIGTTAPSSQFSVGADASGTPTISLDYTVTNTSVASISASHNTGEVRFFAKTNYFPTFYSSNSERARIDTSGRLLVGTSSAASNVYIKGDLGSSTATTPNMQLAYTGNSYAGLAITSYTSGGYAGTLALQASDGALNSNTAVVNNQAVGIISFNGNDGTNFIPCAEIKGTIDGTPGTNDMPGRLVFSTTADGASSPTERMRIDNAGKLLVGATTIPVSTTTSYFADTRAFVNGDTLTDQCAAVVANGSASGSNNSGASTCYLARYSTAAATTPGAIFKGYQDTTIVIKINNNGNITNSNNSYGSLSDIKLKENIVDAASQWSDIKNLRVCNYNFKEETGQQTHRQIGLIAQEVELVSPGLVADSPDADGGVTKTLNYSVLYMKAVKALQEAMDRIETLEAEVAALKGA
jgi:hypothetical protein